MLLVRCSFLPALFSWFFATCAHGQGSPPGFAHFYQFDGGIDGGGDFSSNTSSFDIGLPLITEEGKLLVLGAKYTHRDYAFSGGSFGELDPWDEIHAVGVSSVMRWAINDKWTFFGLPSLRFEGEGGATIEDGLTGGLISGFQYRVSDKLTIGPGFGYGYKIEDDPRIHPVIFLDWEVSDSLILTTGPTPGFGAGPGLAARYALSDEIELVFGGRWTSQRFRLAENNAAQPGGVGEEESVRFFGSVTYAASSLWEVTLLAGTTAWGDLTVEDEGGDEVLSLDTDPAPFVGLSATLRF